MTLIVTWLWQGLAIACITVLALKATPRLNAATRHVIWWLALAAVLAIPVVHFAAPQAEAPLMPEVVKSASVGAVVLVYPAASWSCDDRSHCLLGIHVGIWADPYRA